VVRKISARTFVPTDERSETHDERFCSQVTAGLRFESFFNLMYYEPQRSLSESFQL
jgi:hypothetical protein